MNVDEFAKICMVRVVPEHEGTPDLALEPWRRDRLWLYTHGLAEFGLPELELRNVHPFWLAYAVRDLTGWAHQWTEAPDRQSTDENFQVASVDGLHVTARLKQSTSDHWKEHPTGCFEINLVAIEAGCSCCECGGGKGTVH